MQSVSLKCSCIYCLKVLNFTLFEEYPLQKLVFIHRIAKYFEIFLHKLSLSPLKSISCEHTKVADHFYGKYEVFKRINLELHEIPRVHYGNKQLSNHKFWSKNILSELEGKVFLQSSSLTLKINASPSCLLYINI